MVLCAAGSWREGVAAHTWQRCCRNAAQASRMKLRRQRLARTGRETGHRLKYCKETWSAMATSRASWEALTKRSGVAGEAPCC
jgi:hypothetical protein